MTGGLAAGEIIAKDDASVTVKLRDGGTKIVFVSDKTEIGKAVVGSAADLEVGKTVMATGMPNADGSLTAQNIQLRADGGAFMLFGGPDGAQGGRQAPSLRR
jgi:hypothetical protein